MTGVWDGVERRREPRVAPDEPVEWRVPMLARVRVLDLSETGALITTDAFLPTGLVGQLSAPVATQAFSTLIRVLRNSPGRHPDRRELGVQFQQTEPGSRERLEAFLRRASR